ncbi:MAG: helicase C-terminal domain-containing protein, partial [Halobacteriales archaeon]|nr:helicase C-terminal domain-containing protein [Halobacteriales archaeon]
LHHGRAMYACTTKTLQRQFLDDFEYADVLMGRANYPTLDRPHLFPSINAGDCVKMRGADCSDCRSMTMAFDDDETDDGPDELSHCRWCHPVAHCPYELAKGHFLYTETVGVLNTAYMLTEWNGPGRTSKRFDLAIVDEADELETELMRFIEFEMPRSLVRRMRIPTPERKTVREAWVEWAERYGIPMLGREVKRLRARVDPSNPEPKAVRAHKAAKTRLDRLKKIAHAEVDPYEDTLRIDEEQAFDGWAYTGYDQGHIQFKAIDVREDAGAYLWRHAPRFLLMSATIISPDQMAFDLGLEPSEWAAVRVDSGFPVERRPIFVHPVANMKYSERATAEPAMAEGVADVVRQYPGERVLVHTVSYRLANVVVDHLRKVLPERRTVTYSESAEREDAIGRFLSNRGSVLVASSLQRGVDFPDDQCRVQIVAKVPFPSLGDKQVSARLYSPGGKSWYGMLTVRSLVQMTGRAMRHEDDWCDTWILDSQFGSNVWRNSKALIPSWWAEALEWFPTRVPKGPERWR